jgi:hypothetical protein
MRIEDRESKMEDRRAHWILPFSILYLLCSILSVSRAGEPSTKASDPSLDWMLSHATTAPATSAPTTAPVDPLVDRHQPRSRTGTITLSDGTKLNGEITTTADKPLRVYDDEARQYVDVPIHTVASISSQVVWERDEKEYQFKLSGSDEKVYSGRTYPARETRYTVTTVDGHKVSGEMAAPIYFKDGDTRRTFILHKRDKGEVGQTLKQLVYVKSVQFK